jgi:hypothetical protein
MRRRRLRLPHWTAHPGFGVAALLALAVTLIAHGEPQPAARDNGKSVVVSGSPQAPPDLPSTLLIRKRTLELRQHGTTRIIRLPDGAVPMQVLTSRGLTVVLGVLNDRQRAYAVSKSLAVTDLGFADAMIPAVTGNAAVLVEASLTAPGRVATPVVSPTDSTADVPTQASAAPTAAPELRDFTYRRYDASGRAVGPAELLPSGMRLAADTAVGLTVWQPVNRVFDGGVPLEANSAAGLLIRPDGSLRSLGPVRPLAATATELLVWDVQRRQFALMPLRYATATSTATATPSVSSTPTERASPGPSPTTVAGIRYYTTTRGFIVTGPAAFSPDAAAVAVYAQVGTRRRLVVTDAGPTLSNQIEVLALSAPQVKPSPATTLTPSGSATPGPTTAAAEPSATSSAPVFEADGFPIPAPLAPVWWKDQVIGVGTEGTVVGYRPGSGQATLLDLGVTAIQSLALAP